MAATLEQVLDAVEARLATITTLRVHDVVPDSVNVFGTTSAAIVMCPDIPSYRATMGRGVYMLAIDTLVLTGAQSTRAGQRRLMALAGPTGDQSIRAAVEGDKTLGGVVSDSYLDSFRRLGLEEVATIGYFGGIFTINVALTGV